LIDNISTIHRYVWMMSICQIEGHSNSFFYIHVAAFEWIHSYLSTKPHPLIKGTICNHRISNRLLEDLITRNYKILFDEESQHLLTKSCIWWLVTKYEYFLFPFFLRKQLQWYQKVFMSNDNIKGGKVVLFDIYLRYVLFFYTCKKFFRNFVNPLWLCTS
jgi:hypothetical protein